MDSNWYGGKDYTDKLVEDDKIRTYLMARLRKASVSNIIIERTLKLRDGDHQIGPPWCDHREGRIRGRQAA